MSSVSIKFDSAGLEAKLDAMAERIRDDAVRPAAQASAEVFYREVLARVPVKTGKLQRAIYQAFSAKNSGPGEATYHVSWNKRKAPHGHLVEFGTVRAPAHPFIRPAFDAAQTRALEAAKQVFIERAGEAIRGS